jgi:hypothetical protein
MFGPMAGGLQSLGAVVLPEPHDSQTGAVALLRVGTTAQDLGYEPPRGWADLAGPADQP